MNLQDVGDERRRGAHLLVSFAIAAALTIAAWDRLAVPFSTKEALFVHEALRASGQAATPDFSIPDDPVPAQVLGFFQQLVGTSERPLRLVFLLLLAATAWFLAELLPEPDLAASAVLTLGLVGSWMVTPACLVSPDLLPLLPAALALLAAPLGPRITTSRALLGLAGMLALGALGSAPAFAAAAAVAAVSLVRGSLLDRLTGFVTAGVGAAAGFVLASSRPGFAFVSGAEAGARSSVLDWWVVAAGAAVVVASLIVAAGRWHRIALVAASVAAAVPALAALMRLQQPIRALDQRFPDLTDLTLGVAVARVAPILLLASAVAAFRPAVRVVLAALMAALVAFGLLRAPPEDRTALDVLADARTVAQPGAALAVAGEHRVAVALYARLGHAPSMPVFYVPESAALDAVSAVCRKNEVRQLWLFPPHGTLPPGLSIPESRPTGVKKLMLLVVE
jgi:hypothetical protein